MRGRDGCGVVALFAIAMGVVLAMPGALVTYAVAGAASVALDRGQLWTFALASSFVLYCATLAASGGFFRGTARYFLVSVAAVTLVAVARFGLHAEWPVAFVRAFVG